MRTGTVSYKVDDLRKSIIIPIGFVGENDFTRVIFDAEEIYKNYPAAQVSMKVQPPKGGIYPATVTRDGNSVIWQVKAADVAHKGSGELQLTFTADTMVEKSYIAKTDIKRSLVGNGPAPDPVQDWLDEAQEALEDIESAEVHQPTIGTDGYWYKWNQETGEYEKTDTKAQGTDGHSPVLTSSKSGKTTTIYADGTQLAQIQDGEDGQGADVIDDTAGEGDTNKTWSADKLDEELTDVKNAIQGIDDFLGDTDTDLGTHDIVTETDLINMTPGTHVDADVTFTITKTTISANGTASKSILRTAQDIALDAGYYLFAIDHPITSADYQIQLFNTGNNSIIKSFTSAQAIFDYYFTLESAVNARIRAYAVSGANVDHQLHEVTLKKISRETFDNTVAYYLAGLGSSGVGFYTGIEVGTIVASDGQPGSSPSRCRTKDYISVDKFVLCDLTKKTGYDLYLFLYDENKNFLQRIPSDWANTYYTHASIVTTYPSAKYIKIIFRRHNDGIISSVDIAEMQGVISIYQSEGTIETFEDFRSMLNRSRFDDQFNYIAYSKLSANDAPANTEEHYLKCAKADFTALKGDVRNTADRGLIMCHDPGYTFDGNNKITTYNNSNKTLINTLTVAECKALTFAEQYNSQDCHPTDFDTYVKICKKYGKIAFVTVRDEQIDSVVAPNVIATLKKYRMMDRAIINSFTIATLTKFREFDSNIMLSLVMNQNTAPSISTVDAVMTLGNCMLNLFDIPLPSGSTLEDILTSYDPVIRYAINNGVMVYEAQTNNSMTDTLLAHGITGSHMTQIPDYNE